MATKDEAILSKFLRVQQGDGSLWDVPVMVIARSRAENYADEYEGDVEKSLAEDTGPCFAESPFEVQDWAANNMNWSDVADHAVRVEPPPAAVDWEEGWMNGEKRIVADHTPPSSRAARRR